MISLNDRNTIMVLVIKTDNYVTARYICSENRTNIRLTDPPWKKLD